MMAERGLTSAGALASAGFCIGPDGLASRSAGREPGSDSGAGGSGGESASATSNSTETSTVAPFRKASDCRTLLAKWCS